MKNLLRICNAVLTVILILAGSGLIAWALITFASDGI